MKKIIKLVLILGILVFSILNSVQAEELDGVLCCPRLTMFDEITKVCYGPTQARAPLAFGSAIIPYNLPRKAVPGADALRAIERDNNCNNIYNVRVGKNEIVDSWKIIEIISKESSGTTQSSLEGVSPTSLKLVMGTPTLPTSCKDFFLSVFRKPNGDFTDQKTCREDREKYYDCSIIKIEGGKEIPVLCKERSLLPQISPEKATVVPAAAAGEYLLEGPSVLTVGILRDAPAALKDERVSRYPGTPLEEAKVGICLQDNGFRVSDMELHSAVIAPGEDCKIQSLSFTAKSTIRGDYGSFGFPKLTSINQGIKMVYDGEKIILLGKGESFIYDGEIFLTLSKVTISQMVGLGGDLSYPENRYQKVVEGVQETGGKIRLRFTTFIGKDKKPFNLAELFRGELGNTGILNREGYSTIIRASNPQKDPDKIGDTTTYEYRLYATGDGITPPGTYIKRLANGNYESQIVGDYYGRSRVLIYNSEGLLVDRRYLDPSEDPSNQQMPLYTTPDLLTFAQESTNIEDIVKKYPFLKGDPIGVQRVIRRVEIAKKIYGKQRLTAEEERIAKMEGLDVLLN